MYVLFVNQWFVLDPQIWLIMVQLVELSLASGVWTSGEVLKLSRLDDELIQDLLNWPWTPPPTSTSYPLMSSHDEWSQLRLPRFFFLFCFFSVLMHSCQFKLKNEKWVDFLYLHPFYFCSKFQISIWKFFSNVSPSIDSFPITVSPNYSGLTTAQKCTVELWSSLPVGVDA